ncbi:helix-turn-helix domain-containing protein [Cognatishimia activa]|uniref:Helix-turn-helix transcriptional regulator n=1 Tax=Cognatishimia activa TaxID=1715691 RepID=A0A975EMB0_9RHOB|nr:helix-turn-helix transcriptional regulator [Cognatishimia activa]QTN34669.1 helix-turn-helix transcriptional regulator [Cognatishimia activa]
MNSSQLRMARAATRLSVRELAELAGVTPATISRFETEKGGLQMKTVQSIQGALEKLGVVFVAKNGGPAGIRYEPIQED